MPQQLLVRLRTQAEPPITLEVSDTLVALRGTPRTEGWRSIPRGATPVLLLPESRVQVLQTDSADQAIATISELRTRQDLSFVGRGLAFPLSQRPVLYTENCYVQFRNDVPESRQRELLTEAGMVVKSVVGFAEAAYWTSLPAGTGLAIFGITSTLLDRPEVLYSYPELVWERERAAIFDDQWTLRRSSFRGVQIDASASVDAAQQLARGEGITIAVIDDGFDLSHEELACKRIVAPFDFLRNDTDPRFRSHSDNHGTACAGVACAMGLRRMSGVAPDASLMPLRVATGTGSMLEALAFEWAARHHADVISCSWTSPSGPFDDPDHPSHAQHYPLQEHTRQAMAFAMREGRRGRGCVIVFAAGNGNASADLDGYPSCEGVIAVGACNVEERRSAYSDFGDCVHCVFPSNDPTVMINGASPNVLTLDIRLTPTAPSAYRNDFGGTSASCAGVAGVVALVLSIAGHLRLDDVRGLLALGCERIDVPHGQYGANGHSPWYGFGRLNAAIAVQRAIQAAHACSHP